MYQLILSFLSISRHTVQSPYMVVIRSPNIVVDRRSPGMTPGQTHLLCSSLSRVEDLTVPLLAHAVPAQRTDVGT